MKKLKIKTGNIELPDDLFNDEFAETRISMMIPLKLYKALKAISLKKKYKNDFKELVTEILTGYVENKKDGKVNKRSDYKPVSKKRRSDLKKIAQATLKKGKPRNYK